MTKIEQVAKAIWGARDHLNIPWRELPERQRDQVRKEARAAIEAMWQPTPGMIKAGMLLLVGVADGDFQKHLVIDIHDAMVEAALDETEEKP